MRHSIFSEEDDLVQSFNVPSYAEEWEKVVAKEVQTALRRSNPIVGIKQLLAFHTTSQAFQLRSITILLRSIRVLLIVNLVLMLAVIYFMFSK